MRRVIIARIFRIRIIGVIADYRDPTDLKIAHRCEQLALRNIQTDLVFARCFDLIDPFKTLCGSGEVTLGHEYLCSEKLRSVEAIEKFCRRRSLDYGDGNVPRTCVVVVAVPFDSVIYLIRAYTRTRGNCRAPP